MKKAILCIALFTILTLLFTSCTVFDGQAASLVGIAQGTTAFRKAQNLDVMETYQLLSGYKYYGEEWTNDTIYKGSFHYIDGFSDDYLWYDRIAPESMYFFTIIHSSNDVVNGHGSDDLGGMAIKKGARKPLFQYGAEKMYVYLNDWQEITDQTIMDGFIQRLEEGPVWEGPPGMLVNIPLVFSLKPGGQIQYSMRFLFDAQELHGTPSRTKNAFILEYFEIAVDTEKEKDEWGYFYSSERYLVDVTDLMRSPNFAPLYHLLAEKTG